MKMTSKEYINSRINTPVKRNKSEETLLQKKVVRYIRNIVSDRYKKNFVLISNPFSSVKMKPYQMKQAKDLGFQSGQPDLVIISKQGNYTGLALELKAEGVKLFKKDGALLKNEHLQQQYDMLHKYRQQGYIARFSIGFDETINHINSFFGIE